ncbi:hypothetical protein CIT292_11144 [Citrobacter youngae ATCC 29220]|uniref:Uncharacterized protein n=1 Tax=Citrobacter youngae ATCC 29220 TaxID=500640 RepID=D4BKR4_9ENTR|nr:hypothetical protein CIT292_11144 [Citrobacter youngae ATCC 29220]
MPDGAALIRPTRPAYRCRPDKALSRVRRKMCLMALRLSGLQDRHTDVGRIRR